MKSPRLLATFACITLGAFHQPAAAAPGDLDPTFGGGTGVVTTDIGSEFNAGWSVALQSDRKIVVAGISRGVGGYDIAVARYRSDGRLDTTFNGTGKVTTDTRGSDDFGYCVAVQRDGKIVVGGYSTVNPVSGHDFTLVRYLSNGSLDTTFNGTGKVTTDINNSADVANGIALQSDGKIVLAGESTNIDGRLVALMRYRTDGSLDTTFNGTGKVTTAIHTASGEITHNDVANSVAIQTDGRIVVAGFSWGNRGAELAVLRYNADGSLDQSFNGTGTLTTLVGTGFDQGRSVALQSDGKIVVAGSSGNTDNNLDIALVRFHANGSLDTSFNGTGKVTTAIGSGDDSGYGVVVQDDGRIVVTGRSKVSGNYNDIVLLRYNPDGNLDPSFHGTGKVTTALGGRDDFGQGVVLQSDGRIVVAGGADKGVVGDVDNGIHTDFALLRYDSRDIEPPTTVHFFKRGAVPGAGVIGSGVPAGAIFGGFGVPAINDAGDVAFRASWTSRNGSGTGIFAGKPASLIVKAGDTTPGLAGATFKKFLDPVLDPAGHAAFFATVAGPGTKPVNATVLATNAFDGGLEILAREDSQAADAPAGAKWRRLISAAISGGATGPLFLGTLAHGSGGVDASNDLGIWAVDSVGSLRVVIREGDIVEGKKLRSFVALSATPGSPGMTRSFNNHAKLIYRATFTDGTSAVVETTIP